MDGGGRKRRRRSRARCSRQAARSWASRRYRRSLCHTSVTLRLVTPSSGAHETPSVFCRRPHRARRCSQCRREPSAVGTRSKVSWTWTLVSLSGTSSCYPPLFLPQPVRSFTPTTCLGSARCRTLPFHTLILSSASPHSVHAIDSGDPAVTATHDVRGTLRTEERASLLRRRRHCFYAGWPLVRPATDGQQLPGRCTRLHNLPLSLVRMVQLAPNDQRAPNTRAYGRS